ncbi:hypothetical protein KCV87_12755 [Actinosynnema pretiosum subsp. pretiosum]|uniref:Uncharacterized protein n=2 Tax=Actinosynnema TaxID=40566 RepID=C6WAM0_ACTMD|nr:MarR family transcriptional regulator [Actinosynnema mirum]ACU35487.1 hypothetical protein Amir_1537 [Actinosynnema mirum DSM 43827]QUF06834.1 hypothetical protein KCV87_12755 [Actinosynnema pretiosum subsp. pretiosum]
MRFEDRVVALLRTSGEAMTDAEIARALGVVHQQVNAVCRRLAAAGVIVRDDADRPIRNHLPDSLRVVRGLPVPAEVHEVADVSERAVQQRLVDWLLADGWKVVRVADTRSRERGTDVVVERGARTLHVEVKGFPSSRYVDPARAGEVKRTLPAVQARSEFAAALLKGLQLRQAHPDDVVALALPDRLTHRRNLESVASVFPRMGLTVFLVGDDGAVEARWGEQLPAQG